MFCTACGTKLEDGAKFCTNCGAQQGAAANVEAAPFTIKEAPVDKNKVVLKVQPAFLIKKQLIENLGTFIVMLLGLIGGIFLIAQDNKLAGTAIMGWIVIGVLFVLPLMHLVVTLYLRKREYENLEYKFYPDRLEYIDGFLNKSQKEVKYKNVREIVLIRRVWDRMFGLGKIFISTSAEGGFSGVFLSDILDSEEMYEKIKKVTDK